jgi:hypothetical protein
MGNIWQEASTRPCGRGTTENENTPYSNLRLSEYRLPNVYGDARHTRMDDYFVIK